MQKTEYGGKKTVDQLVGQSFTDVCRRNPDGTCCGCGSCCERVLPMRRIDIMAIELLLRQKPDLTKRIREIYMFRPHRMCPFLDVTKAEHKCLIYSTPALPPICKYFTCHKFQQVVNLSMHANEFHDTICVDLWFTFFGKFTGDHDIAPAWLARDLLRERTGKRPPMDVLTRPETLPNFMKNNYPHLLQEATSSNHL